MDFTGSDIHDVRLLTEYEQNESDTPLSRPLISIYMPTWNRRALTIRAIQSVLNQDYVNWELIIIDDFSSSFDQLLTYISELNDPRITYIRNEFNSGACAVRNQAIRMARGDLITGLDDDDEWLPTRLSSFLTRQHKLQLHSFCTQMIISVTVPDIIILMNYRCIRNRLIKSLFDKRNIIGNQMLTLTSRMQQILFDDALPAAQDYDAFIGLQKPSVNLSNWMTSHRCFMSITAKPALPAQDESFQVIYVLPETQSQIRRIE